MADQTERGGIRAGAGRKPLAPEGEVGVVYKLRMTQTQRAKLSELGGAAWIRTQIDSAHVKVQVQVEVVQVRV